MAGEGHFHAESSIGQQRSGRLRRSIEVNNRFEQHNIQNREVKLGSDDVFPTGSKKMERERGMDINTDILFM